MQLNKEYLSLDKQSYNEYENNYKILEKYCNMCTYPEDLNVTLVSETGKVFYCKDYHDIEDYINWYTDYYKDYSLFKKYWKYKLFALEAVEDCSFINYGYNEYWFSLDNGKNWYYSDEATPLPIVKAGKRMMFIGDMGYLNWWNEQLDGPWPIGHSINELGDYDFIEISNTGGFENNLNGDWDNKLKGFSIFRSSEKYKVVGDLSSFGGDCDYPTEQSRQYFQMFDGSENLVSAKNLYIPWQTICDNGLKRFFCNCVSLEEPPILFATGIGQEGYKEMFCGCISLKKHPIMCVQSPHFEAFKYMFDGCTSLEEIDPQIFNIDTLDNAYVYAYMYRNTNIKELKDTNIIFDTEDYIFKGTFQGSKLTKISNVNFIEINDGDEEQKLGQLEYLFKDCNDLLSVENTKIFNSPDQRVIHYKFKGMFENCHKLEYIDPDIFYDFIKFDDPEGYRCFENVFKNCYNLKNAPKLLTLNFIIDGDAFYGAFENCWSLEKAPDLNALWDQPYGYSRMFYNCKSLKYIKCNLITNNDNCLEDWVVGVPPGGTFVKDPRAQWDDIGDSGVPYGWTIDYQIAKDESLIFYYDVEMYNSNLSGYNELYLKNLAGNSTYDLNLVDSTKTTSFDKYITFNNGSWAPKTMYTHPNSSKTTGSTFELLIKFPDPTSFTAKEYCVMSNYESGGEGINSSVTTVNDEKVWFVLFQSYVGGYTNNYRSGNGNGSIYYINKEKTNYWWHFVGTRTYENNNTTLRFYINGKDCGRYTTINNAQLVLPRSSTVIMYFNNASGTATLTNLIPGISMSSSRYYERPLTDEEIKKNFEWEKNRTGFEFLEI